MQSYMYIETPYSNGSEIVDLFTSAAPFVGGKRRLWRRPPHVYNIYF